MNSGINLRAIYIANIMGVLLMFIMLYGNTWKLKNDDIESICIRKMILITLMACIVDPIVFTADGKPGLLCFIAVYGGNLFLFSSCIMIGLLWVNIVTRHTGGTLRRKQKVFFGILCILGAVVLIINFFVPIVFSVNSENVYSRELLFWLCMAIDSIFILDGVIVYVIAKIKGGVFKFFPVWQFIVPIVVGMLIQTLTYGVSTIWPCIAISISGLLNSLQNETVYLDHLTGLYNRLYLDNVKREIMKKETGNITAMMLDMNDFKSINDIYGHSAGDQALTVVAGILKDAIGTFGSVIRYAGDEFVVLLNTQNVEKVSDCIASIRENIEKYNRNGGKQYKLSLSIGYCSLDLKKHTVDDLLMEVDRRMYEDKDVYYTSNTFNSLDDGVHRVR